MFMREVLSRLTNPQLREFCAAKNVPTTGRKNTLIRRLINVSEISRDETLHSARDEIEVVTSTPIPKQPEEKSDAEMSSSEDENASSRGGVRVPQFTFNDIGDSLEKFSGERTDRDIRDWLEEFENTSENFGWTEAHKYVYGRRLLKGTAKLFVNSSSGLNDWATLKSALEEEFSDKVSSAEIHELLRNRKKKSDESFLQYVYHMQNIAKRGRIEEEAVCEYVANGVNDIPVNKVCLYGAKNIADLKDRIKQYEKMKSQMRESSNRATKNTTTHDREKEKREPKSGAKDSTNTASAGDSVRCYNCGNRGHYANDCDTKARGPKCFGCGEHGHRAKDCEREKKKAEVNALSEGMPVCEIQVDGFALRTLFDTGSRYNLLCESVYVKIGKPLLHRTTMSFSGFGAAKTSACGTVEIDVGVGADKFPTMLFYVVPPGCMKYDAILGMSALEYMDVEVNEKGVNIKKKVNEADAAEESEIMQILNTCERESIDVDPPYVEVIKEIIENYNPKSEVHSRVETKIILTDDEPVHSAPRRFAPKEKKVLEETIDEWLKTGIVRESVSEYASPVTLAPKKNGSLRVCVDYRQLNRKMVKDCFPMRNIEDQIDKLKNAKVFTTLDLKNSFFHVPVEASSQKYTSFVTHMGQYEFLKTPFGLCNSPASFSRFVADVFRELIKSGVLIIYVDDAIIATDTPEENIAILRQVLKVASENGLQFNWEKSQFLKSEVEYLGYLISEGKYRLSPEKIRAVKNFRVPVNEKELQRFLGLTSYFRKFVPGYALIARPLTDLLKKDVPFVFGEKQSGSFEQLKGCLVSDPVLKIYDAAAETEVHTDASKEGYGAVLLQRDCDGKFHPVYYMSQKTKSAEKNYSAYHLEVLAVVNAVERFRVYLLGIPFKIVTDCAAFQHTLKGKHLSPRVARWALLLEEYTYTVEHRPGIRMQHVDALSRAPVMVTTGDPLVELIKTAQGRDERLRVICELLKTQPFEDYIVTSDMLMKIVDGREVVVVPAELQSEIIRRAHESGHFGAKKLEDIIKRDYYIPQLGAKIKRQIECCVKCILAERKRGKTEGLLSPIPKGDVPFDTYHVDHVGPMDATEKLYKYLFVVVDGFTKYVWIYPTKTTNAAEVIQRLRQQSELFGNPRRIVSDKGSAFTSHDFKEYCAEQNVEHIEITTGVPRGNGQVERVNQVILAMLTKLSVDDKTKWYKHVGNIQRWINGSVHQSTSVTPFEALFGVQIRHEGDIRLGEMLEEIKVAQFDDQRCEIRMKARAAIEKAQEEQRKAYNLRAKPATDYRPGDVVAIKRTQFGPGKKYASEYLGPYKVVTVKANNRYDVEKVSGEGPKRTSTAACHMKRYRVWSPDPSQDDRDVRQRETDDE